MNRTFRRWPWQPAAAVVAAATLVGLLVALAADLRLTVGRTSFVFAGFVSFGFLSATTADAWRSATAMLAGSTLAAAAWYAALDTLPFTPAGRGVALGVGAAVAASLALALRRRVPVGAVAAGFGLGVAASQLTPVSASLTIADFLATATTVGFAIVVGAAVQVGVRLIQRARSGDAATDDDAFEIAVAERSSRTEARR